MPLLDAKGIPQVAMSFMNDDHEEAVEILNELLVAIENGSDNEITLFLEKFIAHNQAHFSREEEQMIRVNFPPYRCHKGEHERVLAELRVTLEDWKEEKDRERLAEVINGTVLSWFINHINTMDTVTANYINQHTL